MKEKYSLTLNYRWFGVPCEDEKHIIGYLSSMPDSVQAAEKILDSMGLNVLFNDPNSYSDGFSMSVAVAPETGKSIDYAWVDIYPDYTE